jgi:restriction endonuclease Mrr
MGVPSFQQLMLPALQTIGQRYDEISISGLEDEVSRALKISVEERQLRLPSGNQTLFANRLNWARSYLSKVGNTGEVASEIDSDCSALFEKLPLRFRPSKCPSINASF